MDAVQKGILTLVRSAISGEKLPLPDGFDLETAYPILQKHSILALAYDGAVRCGLDKRHPVMQKLFQNYLQCLVRSERQMQAVEDLCEAFEDNGIDYMLLKGCNLKKLYPKPELRQMGDADVLIRVEQYETIKPIVRALGYREVVESDHELIWNHPSLHLELHKRLIPSYNKDYYAYFGDGWQLSKKTVGRQHEMTPEDTFVYLFTHFAKHYRDGGIGLRHVTDLWVYSKAHPDLDQAYMFRELNKLQLQTFCENVMRLLRVWFEEEEADAKTDFLSSFVFDSGNWGSRESHVASVGAKNARAAGSIKKGVVRRWLKVFFPDRKSLQLRYPILKNVPLLLPLVWLYRFVDVLITRRKNVRKQMENLNLVSPDQIQTYQQALNYVGLDFHFKE